MHPFNFKHSMLGNGQVAHAVGDNLAGVIDYYDKGQWEKKSIMPGTLLHICIPYNKSFVEVAKAAISKFNPQIVVVHSTVKEGTTAQVGKAVLYSPVMGRHKDDFATSVRQFHKFFAGPRTLFDAIVPTIDIGCRYWGPNTMELEFAKLMSTSYMYWNLVYEKVMYNECKHKGYDASKVYKRWNRNYNEGYGQTHPEWCRPVYEHVDDARPGGHCLGPNIQLTDNFITDILRKWHDKEIPIVDNNKDK